MVRDNRLNAKDKKGGDFSNRSRAVVEALGFAFAGQPKAAVPTFSFSPTIFFFPKKITGFTFAKPGWPLIS